jgi:hypothetical protein
MTSGDERPLRIAFGYRFAVAFDASLMLGWPGLLQWAYLRPIERRFVVVLHAVVMSSFVRAEMVAVHVCALESRRMWPC